MQVNRIQRIELQLLTLYDRSIGFDPSQWVKPNQQVQPRLEWKETLKRYNNQRPRLSI